MRPTPLCVSMLLGLAGAASAQPLTTEIPPSGLPTGPITAIAPGVPGAPMWACAADAAVLWQRGATSGTWTPLETPVFARPQASLFIPDGGAMLANFGSVVFYSPRGNGLWRSATGDPAFQFASGIPAYAGWDFDTDYRFNAVGMLAANGALYAAMGRDEGNNSNGHSSSWSYLGSAGVMKSTDNGQSWTSFAAGLPTYQSDPFFGVTREPINVFGAVGNTLLLETGFEKIYRSVNNGAWQLVPNRGGLPTFITNFRSVQLLGWVSNARGLIAVVRLDGLHRSTNGGLSYTLDAVAGLPALPDIRTFINTPEGLFFAVVGEATEEQPSPPTRLYRSIDDGLSFRRHGAPISSGITTIAHREGRLYLGTTGLGLVSISTSTCTADVGAQGGINDPDGLLDNNDFVAFINAFFTQDLLTADIGQTGGVTGADGQLDNNDFVVYINAFFTGCG